MVSPKPHTLNSTWIVEFRGSGYGLRGLGFTAQNILTPFAESEATYVYYGFRVTGFRL